MKNLFKRLSAVLLSLSMVFCLMSANAWAQGDADAEHAVARINDQYYSTLQKAFDAAEYDDTVTLLRDITNVEQIGQEMIGVSDNAITLDLNGRTIQLTKDGSALPLVFQKDANALQGTVSIENGTVINDITADHVNLYIGGGIGGGGGLYAGTLNVTNDGWFCISNGYFASEPDESYVAAGAFAVFPNYDDLEKQEDGHVGRLAERNKDYPFLVAFGVITNGNQVIRFNRNTGDGSYDTQGRFPVGHWGKLRTFGDNPDNARDPALITTNGRDIDWDNPPSDLENLITLPRDGYTLGTKADGKTATWIDASGETYDDGAVVWLPRNGLVLNANWIATGKTDDNDSTLKTQKLTLSLKDKGKNISAKKLAKKAQKTTIKVKGAKTKLTFKSSNKKIATVSKKGVVTFKKGVKKGKSVKITVTAKATDKYKAAKKTITIKVKK